MITNDQYDKVKHMLSTINRGTEKITDWELDFASNIEVALSRYGQNVNLSCKQIACLDRIYEKVTEPS